LKKGTIWNERANLFSFIGQSWYSSFAFWIVGLVFLVWMFFQAISVSRNQVDDDQEFTGGGYV